MGIYVFFFLPLPDSMVSSPPTTKNMGQITSSTLISKSHRQLWSPHLLQIYTEKMNDRFTLKNHPKIDKSVKNHSEPSKIPPPFFLGGSSNVHFSKAACETTMKNFNPRNWGHAAARISQQPGAVGDVTTLDGEVFFLFAKFWIAD